MPVGLERLEGIVIHTTCVSTRCVADSIRWRTGVVRVRARLKKCNVVNVLREYVFILRPFDRLRVNGR